MNNVRYALQCATETLEAGKKGNIVLVMVYDGDSQSLTYGLCESESTKADSLLMLGTIEAIKQRLMKLMKKRGHF